jgi:hypothetical protein
MLMSIFESFEFSMMKAQIFSVWVRVILRAPEMADEKAIAPHNKTRRSR